MASHIRVANRRERKAREKSQSENDRLDLIGLWLLFLFVVIFFGIAAEEARKPSIFSNSQNAAYLSGPTDAVATGVVAAGVAANSASEAVRTLMGTKTSPKEQQK